MPPPHLTISTAGGRGKIKIGLIRDEIIIVLLHSMESQLRDLPLVLLSQICERSLNLRICLTSKAIREACKYGKSCESRCMARMVAKGQNSGWFKRLLKKKLTRGLEHGQEVVKDGQDVVQDGLEVVEVLDLDGDDNNNRIGVQGCVALAEALKTNRTVHTLDLSFNYIGVQGCVALAEALKTNATVHTLDLSYNSIGFINTSST